MNPFNACLKIDWFICNSDGTQMHKSSEGDPSTAEVAELDIHEAHLGRCGIGLEFNTTDK